jgi:hypothetical protein
MRPNGVPRGTGGKVGRDGSVAAHGLDPYEIAGGPNPLIRSTRLIDLVSTMDPKLGAAAFGMDLQATWIYFGDRVEQEVELAARATPNSLARPGDHH